MNERKRYNFNLKADGFGIRVRELEKQYKDELEGRSIESFIKIDNPHGTDQVILTFLDEYGVLSEKMKEEVTALFDSCF